MAKSPLEGHGCRFNPAAGVDPLVHPARGHPRFGHGRAGVRQRQCDTQQTRPGRRSRLEYRCGTRRQPVADSPERSGTPAVPPPPGQPGSGIPPGRNRQNRASGPDQCPFLFPRPGRPVPDDGNRREPFHLYLPAHKQHSPHISLRRRGGCSGSGGAAAALPMRRWPRR